MVRGSCCEGDHLKAWVRPSKWVWAKGLVVTGTAKVTTIGSTGAQIG
jgi:hypothetical protein